ncbi:BON domain-containing protein [Pokkaliibacter sp. CJK22405]|uniref:BON domain-containing protein n=1 Tax=Pokkaliibacter sp. CJK22405 TaxID=3384615 RepID=UPI003984F580
MKRTFKTAIATAIIASMPVLANADTMKSDTDMNKVDTQSTEMTKTGDATKVNGQNNLHAKSDDWKGEMKDAWLDGRIETVYLMNKNLNPFDIDTEVEKGEVTLTGNVDSEINKSLAGQLAENIDGVTGVKNNLTVSTDNDVSMNDDDMDASGKSSFMAKVDAATTTATIKTKFLMDSDISGTAINVDTAPSGEVTLTGSVDSKAEKDKAIQVAKDVDGVSDVVDHLTVAAK